MLRKFLQFWYFLCSLTLSSAFMLQASAAQKAQPSLPSIESTAHHKTAPFKTALNSEKVETGPVGGAEVVESKPVENETQFWSKSHFLHLFDKVLESILGDLVGFLVLGLVLALMLKRHIGEVLEKGLKYIGEKLSDSFENKLAMPLVDQATAAGNDFKKYMNAHSVPGVKQENIVISANVKPELEKIDILIKSGNLNQALKDAISLRQQFPKELEVLRKIIEISEESDGQTAKHTTALQILKDAETDFSTDPDYFTLLAMGYVGARESGPRAMLFKEALAAAEKARQLEKNENIKPRRLSAVSMVHFYFSDVEEAIELAAQALKMAMDNVKEVNTEVVARIKNNYAFYLAARGSLEDKDLAIKLAKSALNIDEDNNADDYLPASLDTLGFVLFRFADTKDDIIESLKYFNRALEYAPNDIDYNKHKINAEAALLS